MVEQIGWKRADVTLVKYAVVLQTENIRSSIKLPLCENGASYYVR